SEILHYIQDGDRHFQSFFTHLQSSAKLFFILAEDTITDLRKLRDQRKLLFSCRVGKAKRAHHNVPNHGGHVAHASLPTLHDDRIKK
ncbi:MAG TPA: hypothetical protein VHD33_06075, partial [Legionellaceae bacterium]|nr:hypothetical protein [Legionellaceae bacterium]